MDNNKPVNKRKVVSRKACLSDFLDDIGDVKRDEQYGHKYNNESIQRNQKEFGHRKRIKP